jgi:hypothetical protein
LLEHGDPSLSQFLDRLGIRFFHPNVAQRLDCLYAA